MTPTEQKQVVSEICEVMAGHASWSKDIEIRTNQLFEELTPLVRQFCRSRTRDPQRADELAQETLTNAYRQLPNFRGESVFTTWVLDFAKLYVRADQRKRHDDLTADGLLDEVADEQRSALNDLREQERLALLETALGRLPALEQEALRLRYAFGCSQRDVGKILGLELRTGGRGLLQRCRRNLRREVCRVLEQLGVGPSSLRESTTS